VAQSLQRGLEDSDLVLDLAPVEPAASTSSGAAQEKPLEGGGFAAAVAEQHQGQSVAVVLQLLLVAEALPGAAVGILLGVVALAAVLQAPFGLAAEVEALLEPFVLAAAAVEVVHLEPYAPAAVAVEHLEPYGLVPYYSRFAVAVKVVGLVQIAAAVVGLV